MANKKPTPVLDEIGRNSDNKEYLMNMLEKFLSNEGGIVDAALNEIECKDKAKQRKADKMRAKDLEIRITADGASDCDFAITIKNIGTFIYRDFIINYGDILLSADGFGTDTTRIDPDSQHIEGDEIFITELSPGDVLMFVRKGYGTHEMYYRESKRVVRLEFADKTQINKRADVSWAYAVINLPNAQKRRTEKFYA